jgi:hypothetical protein
MDFFVNQLVANQKKVGNDMLVADPSLIHVPSLEDPEPGRVILIAEEAWGLPNVVNTAVAQLKYYETTGQNLSYVGFLQDTTQRVTGTAENLQGIIQPGGERRTATEVSGARQSALSRLQKAVRLGAVQSMYDLGLMLASNTQQFMTMSRYIRIAGRYEQQIRQEYGITDSHILVDPAVLNVNLDLIPRNGAIPGGTNVEAFIQWFQMLSANPATAGQLDVLRASRHIARELGAGNVDEFIRPAINVMPDNRLTNEVQAGNLVPTDTGVGVF